MQRETFRPPMRLGPEAYKTYQILAPKQTHTREASCHEVECDGYKHGWKTIVPDTSPQALYIRTRSGRAFDTALRPGGLVEFTFYPGQTCFRASEHRISLEREPFYRVLGGDHRGNPRGTAPVQRRASEWVDDFATHQQKIADAIEKG
jgi:hypothetical protein